MSACFRIKILKPEPTKGCWKGRQEKIYHKSTKGRAV